MTSNSPAFQTIDARPGGEYPPDLYRNDHVARAVDGFAGVTEEHVEFYREHGYLAIDNAFTKAEVDAALEGLLDLVDGKNTEYTGIQFESSAIELLPTLRRDQKQDVVRKLMTFTDYDMRLKAMAENPDLLALVSRVIDDEPRLFQSMAMLKPPGGGSEKPWHQDNAVFELQVGSAIVGVWIALDPATPENGCMHVIPGSHRDGPVVHFLRRDFQICDANVQSARDVVVPLAPGGLLLFDGLIHHGTPANRTSTRRRALQFHYIGSRAVHVSDDERLAVFGSEGKDAAC